MLRPKFQNCCRGSWLLFLESRQFFLQSFHRSRILFPSQQGGMVRGYLLPRSVDIDNSFFLDLSLLLHARFRSIISKELDLCVPTVAPCVELHVDVQKIHCLSAQLDLQFAPGAHGQLGRHARPGADSGLLPWSAMVISRVAEAIL